LSCPFKIKYKPIKEVFYKHKKGSYFSDDVSTIKLDENIKYGKARIVCKLQYLNGECVGEVKCPIANPKKILKPWNKDWDAACGWCVFRSPLNWKVLSCLYDEKNIVSCNSKNKNHDCKDFKEKD